LRGAKECESNKQPGKNCQSNATAAKQLEWPARAANRAALHYSDEQDNTENSR
jgi:hypothetical protein